MVEYKFSFFVYTLTEAEAEDLRSRLEELIIEEVEKAGKFTSPLIAEEHHGEEGSE